MTIIELQYPVYYYCCSLNKILSSIMPVKDGISLLGRKTPAFILEEVKRRQAADRGTSSLWAKLAAEYGVRHANFIIKHGTKLPTSHNDRNRREQRHTHMLRVLQESLFTRGARRAEQMKHV